MAQREAGGMGVATQFAREQVTGREDPRTLLRARAVGPQLSRVRATLDPRASSSALSRTFVMFDSHPRARRARCRLGSVQGARVLLAP